MANVLIFGTKRHASLAHFYLKQDSPHEVIGFVDVERIFINTKRSAVYTNFGARKLPFLYGEL